MHTAKPTFLIIGAQKCATTWLHRHLRNWLEYYPLHRIKVLILEADIQARPVETLAAVCRFLSVGEHEFTAESVRQTVFAGPRRAMNKNGVFVADDGPQATIADGWHQAGYKDDDGQYWRPVISAGRLQQLNDIFLADVKDLDVMLGTRLVHSWGMTT